MITHETTAELITTEEKIQYLKISFDGLWITQEKRVVVEIVADEKLCISREHTDSNTSYEDQITTSTTVENESEEVDTTQELCENNNAQKLFDIIASKYTNIDKLIEVKDNCFIIKCNNTQDKKSDGIYRTEDNKISLAFPSVKPKNPDTKSFKDFFQETFKFYEENNKCAETMPSQPSKIEVNNTQDKKSDEIYIKENQATKSFKDSFQEKFDLLQPSKIEVNNTQDEKSDEIYITENQDTKICDLLQPSGISASDNTKHTTISYITSEDDCIIFSDNFTEIFLEIKINPLEEKIHLSTTTNARGIFDRLKDLLCCCSKTEQGESNIELRVYPPTNLGASSTESLGSPTTIHCHK